MKKYFNKIRNNKGFTLVELIVVIAVLGIITVLSIPELTKYVEKARQGTDKNALSEVAHAAETVYNSGEKEDNENTISIFIKSDGTPIYSATTSDLVKNVQEILSGDQYVYKSEAYRGSTVTITIDEYGKASFDDPVNYDSVSISDKLGLKNNPTDTDDWRTNLANGAKNAVGAGIDAYIDTLDDTQKEKLYESMYTAEQTWKDIEEANDRQKLSKIKDLVSSLS